MSGPPEPIDVRPSDRPRLPPGQVATRKWPVLHYSHVPRVDLATWRLRVWGQVERPLEYDWEEFLALPHQDVLCDMHCVTQWSRYDNRFSGVPVRVVLERAGPLPGAKAVMVHAEPDYTTNLPLHDLDREGNLFATHFDGEPLTPEHGGPVRLLVPHLYLWKSAKWVRRLTLTPDDEPGFWEAAGYNNHGDPWREQRYWGD